ncbi:nuclear transport factor 2 family protein [Verminephrobacter eiseniae]|uniref:nuclear transport factor 2 family protein n=1 Tax=Verminephrobacter eiseniae TaxID=364317 RepID=UPI0022373D6A|nr:nuclear transport factor 2 family protein [Verminephrobacter eiseniae]
MRIDKVTLSAVDRMLAEQACRDLVVQAAAFTDAQSHEDFAALFTEDGVLIRPGSEHIQGQAAIIESYRSRPAGRITRV